MIHFRKAEANDAKEIKEVQDAAFHDDYVEYGACPGYGRSEEELAASIEKKQTFVIVDDEKIIGKLAAHPINKGHYFVDCVCIHPDYQNQGIGTKAIHYLESEFADAIHWTLVTPEDRLRNRYFYEKAGYKITGKQEECNVKLVQLEKHTLSYCGLNCSLCPIYIATYEKNDEVKSELAIAYSTDEVPLKQQDIECYGCQMDSAKENKICGPCKIRTCAKDRSINICGQCNYYPCNKIETYAPKGSENRDMLDRIWQN